MRISVWSADVCSSDLGKYRGRSPGGRLRPCPAYPARGDGTSDFVAVLQGCGHGHGPAIPCRQMGSQSAERTSRGEFFCTGGLGRSEEHTSELQSLMRISYAVFCLKKNTAINTIMSTRIKTDNTL